MLYLIWWITSLLENLSFILCLHSVLFCFFCLLDCKLPAVTLINGGIQRVDCLWGERDLRFTIIIITFVIIEQLQFIQPRSTASVCSMLLITSMALVEPRLSKQWTSLLRSVLGCFSGLIHHIRAQESWSGPLTSLSPRGWWAEPTVASILPRQFQQVSKTTSGIATARPAVNYRQLFVARVRAPDLTEAAEHRDGPADGGCPTHRVQCSSSVLSAPCTPLTPASCWHAPWHTIPLYLSSSLSSSHFGTC